MSTQKLEFAGHAGGTLAARLDLPEGRVRGYALFAHCFTCSKDIMAVRRISNGLTRQGIGLMRFDFTGLGASDGEFASTNFSSNIEDLKRAAHHLEETFGAPQILIGHSLGGAAVLAAASDMPSVRAVVTIGAPADVAHVLHNFHADLSTIEEDGKAEVVLQGRHFTIEQQFVEDARAARLMERVAGLRRPLLIFHAPRDATVGIDNAAQIFTAAKHPKSFVSLDDADHLLTRAGDGEFVAGVIAGWVPRYLDATPAEDTEAENDTVRVTETGQGKFQQAVNVRGYDLLADEPVSDGGDATGPTPYDFLSIGLGACTSMTLRLYAGKKELDLEQISVEVNHDRVHAQDCDLCTAEQQAKGGRIDRFERIIHVEGGVPDSVAADLLRIADRCPVHRTLEASSAIITRMSKPKS